mmetsp:Transcript_53823/g.149405  ORF Transcript_53823/g.149405 Transcript_53823/m.149405 type:complete len:213 (-) Transcript_53823:1016-1654(-)
MSRTRAPFPPRNRRTVSMNSSKLILRESETPARQDDFSATSVFSGSSGSSDTPSPGSLISKRISFIPTRSSASTPKFVRIIYISGLRMSNSNSSLRTCWSSSLSWTSRMSRKLVFKSSTASRSCSRLDTLVTTSTRIPISMFKIVKLLRKMNTRNKMVNTTDSSLSTGTSSDTASRKVPCNSKYTIETPTCENLGLSSSDASACVLKMIPKR